MPECDLFAAIVDQFGPPAGAVKATPKEIDRYRDRLPSALLDFWVQHGWGSWKDGRTWLCDPALLEPIVRAIFEGDAELAPDDITAIAYNAFGEVLFWHRTRRSITYTAPLGTVTIANPESYADIETGRPTSQAFTIGADIFGPISSSEAPFVDENGKDLFPRAMRRLGPLAPGEIYGFAPALSMGGAAVIANVVRAPIREHLTMLVAIEPPVLYDYVMTPDSFGRLDPLRPLGKPR